MWGVPPQNAADYAFLQHIAKSLDPASGRAAVLLPHGVLTRVFEGAVRQAMVRSDLVEAVIGLAPGLFYNSGMEAIVLILRSRKSPNRRGRVLFINAVDEFARVQAQSFLGDLHQQRILDSYEKFDDEEGFAAVATIEQIADKGYSLAIPLYIKTPNARRGVSVSERIETTVDNWREAAVASDTAIEDVLALLRQEVAR
jgi:type I restriction enzyme M protein